jgi:hypothetical protein
MEAVNRKIAIIGLRYVGLPLAVKFAKHLEIVEVQSGSYLGEDDIVRFEDVYGRLKSSLLTVQNCKTDVHLRRLITTTLVNR